MALNQSFPDVSLSAGMPRQADWVWKIGLVIETPQLLSEIHSALAEAGTAAAFELRATQSSFEVANVVDREKPDILFVELSRTSKSPDEWMMDVRRGEDTPLVVAVHTAADPSQMIGALRAGASEFISLPVRPTIFEAMERLGTLLDSRRSAMVERGKVAGVLSAKGGCGATSIACHLSAALQLAVPSSRVLLADLDCQAPAARHVFRASPRAHAGDAFDAVRRLGSNSWREFVTSIAPGVDLLASAFDTMPAATAAQPEPWRVESLFRFISRQYAWILVDLGRHLNPANWTLLQNIDELFIITAPDVLALYQTRSVLQTLSGRGFDKGRVKIILNRNLSSPQDFWVESIEQMFEMSVFGVIPNDDATLEKLPRERFEFPAETPFGKAIAKIAGRLVRPHAPSPGFIRKAA
jgi:pilus assembly protein CpaE